MGEEVVLADVAAHKNFYSYVDTRVFCFERCKLLFKLQSY